SLPAALLSAVNVRSLPFALFTVTVLAVASTDTTSPVIECGSANLLGFPAELEGVETLSFELPAVVVCAATGPMIRSVARPLTNKAVIVFISLLLFQPHRHEHMRPCPSPTPYQAPMRGG